MQLYKPTKLNLKKQVPETTFNSSSAFYAVFTKRCKIVYITYGAQQPASV